MGDVSGKQAADTILQLWQRVSLGIHRGFFRRAAQLGLAWGQTTLINLPEL